MEPLTFPRVTAGLAGFSDQAMRMHILLYEKHLKELGQYAAELGDILPGTGAVTRVGALMRKAAHARNEVIFHEAFFGALVSRGREPSPSFLQRIERSFGSLPLLLQRLRAAVFEGNGWGLLVEPDELDDSFDLDVISIRGADEGSPFGVRVLFALDAFEHAYWTDFGPAREAYLSVVLENVDWRTVEEQSGVLSRAIRPATAQRVQSAVSPSAPLVSARSFP